MTTSGASAPGRRTAGAGRPGIRLVVNADDFGVSRRVNDGIVAAHRAGIVTAASLMAAGRAFEHAVDWCRRLPSLDIGVHLTLVAERPLTSGNSSLTRGGRLPPGVGAFLRGYALGPIRLADIEAELCAQIERVLDHGLRPTHVDSHQHVHALPGIAGLVRRLADRYGIRSVRAPVEELRTGRPLGAHDARRLAGALALRASWLAAHVGGDGGAGLRFLGFAEGGRLSDARLHALLQALRPGRAYELMCHPGFAPQEPDIQRWGYRHEQELLALTSAKTRALIAARGIRLCTFSDWARSDF
jgi:predicted glycoside hydrolase/deacetylase ChbG (UPF0249 family)